MSWFDSTSPSYLTEAIDRAVADGALESDLALRLEICDIINETQDGARDATRYIRKKLTSSKSSHGCIYKSLLVLETCVKNCHRRFHELICHKDYISTFKKMLTNKKHPLTAMSREKLLTLIQTWADAFRSDPALVNMPRFYHELLAEGVEFPAQNLDEMAPIHTPERSVTAEHRQVEEAVRTAETAPRSASSQDEADAALARQMAGLGSEFGPDNGPVQTGEASRPHMVEQVISLPPGQRVEATEHQVRKIKGDLEIVRNNVEMLREMLVALEANENPEKSDVILDLHVACSQMRERILELVNRITNEELLAQCLTVNDDLSSVLEFFVEVKQRALANAGPTSGSQAEARNESTSPDLSTPQGPPASDIGSIPSRAPPAAANTSSATRFTDFDTLHAESSTDGPDEEDPFAYLRQHQGTSYQQSMAGGSTYEDNTDASSQAKSLSSAVHGKGANNTQPNALALAGMQDEPEEMNTIPLDASHQRREDGNDDQTDTWAQRTRHAPPQPRPLPSGGFKDEDDLFGL